MRLLVFSITFRPFIGGAEIALEEIFKRLPNVSPTIITARLDASLPKKEVYDTLTIYRVGAGSKLDKYLYIPRALKLSLLLHAEQPFSLIQAMMANYAGITAMLFKLRFPQVPYLLSMQSGDSSFFIWIRTFWFYPIYRKVFTKADRVQAISNFLMHRARRHGYRGKGVVIPNGVDYELFSHRKSDEEKAALRIELGIQPEEKVVITTSRLVYKNAVDQLILGFNNWRSSARIPAKLIIVGEGKDEKKLKRLVAKLDIENEVLFLGHKPYTSLPLYLQIADVFVRASRSEGMGNSFIEALAAGVPIVGTLEGGIADFLEHEKTGMAVDKDNPYAIARSINELIQNKKLAQQTVIEGNEVVKERYTWTYVAESMQNLYSELLKK